MLIKYLLYNLERKKKESIYLRILLLGYLLIELRDLTISFNLHKVYILS